MKPANIFSARLVPFLALSLAVWPPGSGYAAKKDGGIVAYRSLSGAAGPVVFSHPAHGISRAGYTCNKCHMAASDKKLAVTMDDIRQGRVCGSCHDGRTKGPHGRREAASIQDCSACHMPDTDIVITMNRMDSVAFSHVRHLSAGSKSKASKSTSFSCGDCHPAPFKRVAKGPVGMEVPHESGACAQCHNGKKRGDGMISAFAANTRCLTCHKSPASLSTDTQP